MDLQAQIIGYIDDLMNDAQPSAQETASVMLAAQATAQTIKSTNVRSTPKRCASGLAAWTSETEMLLEVCAAGRSFLVTATHFAKPNPLGTERVAALLKKVHVHSGSRRMTIVPAARCMASAARPSGDESVLLHIDGTEFVLACARVTAIGEVARHDVRWRAHRAVHPSIAGIYGERNLPVLDTGSLLAELTAPQGRLL